MIRKSIDNVVNTSFTIVVDFKYVVIVIIIICYNGGRWQLMKLCKIKTNAYMTETSTSMLVIINHKN